MCKILIEKDGELVDFRTLTPQEKDMVRSSVTNRLADALMRSLGYKRVEKTQKGKAS